MFLVLKGFTQRRQEEKDAKTLNGSLLHVACSFNLQLSSLAGT
jgi:hypothetical protein